MNIRLPHRNLSRAPTGALFRRTLAIICAFTSVIATTSFTQAYNQTEDSAATTLLAGVLVERAIAGEAHHFFTIQAKTGSYVRLLLDQRGSVLSIKLLGPDGEAILEGLTPNTLADFSRFSFIAKTSGPYKVEISHYRKETPRRVYSIKIEEQRDSNSDDLDRAAADRFGLEAGSLIAAMSADNLKAAFEKYKGALELWQKIGAQNETAQTLLSLGSIANNLSQKKIALEYYQQSLPIWRATGDRKKEAQTLSALGWCYFGAGDLSNALSNYNLALPIRKELNDLRGIAQTLTTLGQVYDALGEPHLAIQNYNEGLELARRAGDKVQQAFALNNFGYMYGNVGEFQKGLNCLAESVGLWRETGNRYGEADALNSMGIIYEELGDFDQSLAHYNRALEIWTFLGYRGGEADALNNIGVAFLNRAGYADDNSEQIKKALDYLNRALELRRKIGQHLGEDSSLVSIGVAYQRLKQRSKAIEYFKEVLERNPRQPNALHNTGLSYYEEKDFAKAIEYLNQALEVSRHRGNKLDEALTLRVLAAAQLDLNQYSAARANALRAFEIVESSRSEVQSPDARMMHRGVTSGYPLVLINVLSELHESQPNAGYAAEAFAVSERAHARGLFEMLVNAGVDLSNGVEPTILARERSLEMQLGAKERYRSRLIDVKGREADLASVNRDIESLSNEYQQARSLLLNNHSNYASLTDPKTVSVKQTQALIDNDTLLLEYRLAEDKSFLWVVSSGAVSMHTLPNRQVITAKARQVYDLMTARNQHPAGETARQRSIRIDQADKEFPEAAMNLSQVLLGPVASMLGKKRLVVVCDGLLQYIPFGSLPIPVEKTNVSKQEYTALVSDHEIVSLPSASVLEVIRQKTTRRSLPAKAVAVFADPVYSVDDPRINSATKTSEYSVAKNESSEDSTSQRFLRLRFSRDEAKNIMALTSARSSLWALDFSASKQTALNSDLSQYRILHFATHGLLDTQHPELSGLALSLRNQDGQILDGYLRLQDIYKLRLNADLVVLSGCQTALGKDMKGEGLIGLTRGFMYAGVPRVIASLWNVDDKATSELMKRFYRGVLVHGLRPADALRAAQKSLAHEPGWSAPYYWAAFTLQGEWK